MQYLFGHFGMWLVVALVLGLVVGLATARWKPGYERADGHFWVGAYLVLIGAGLIIVWMKSVKGLNGLWVETLVMFALAYFIGCLVGALLRGVGAGHGEAELAAALAGGKGDGRLPADAVQSARREMAKAEAARVASATAAEGSVGTVARALEAAKREEAARQAALPPASPALPDEAAHAGERPPGYIHAIGQAPDNLKLISGIGKQNEQRLNQLGIWHFSQIAAWSKANVDWVGSFLAFPGRIEREHWVDQAHKLASGELTDFAQRAARGEVPTSKSS